MSERLLQFSYTLFPGPSSWSLWSPSPAPFSSSCTRESCTRVCGKWRFACNPGKTRCCQRISSHPVSFSHCRRLLELSRDRANDRELHAPHFLPRTASWKLWCVRYSREYPRCVEWVYGSCDTSPEDGCKRLGSIRKSMQRKKERKKKETRLHRDYLHPGASVFSRNRLITWVFIVDRTTPG